MLTHMTARCAHAHAICSTHDYAIAALFRQKPFRSCLRSETAHHAAPPRRAGRTRGCTKTKVATPAAAPPRNTGSVDGGGLRSDPM